MTTRLDLLQGTLDLLILRTLATEPRHGWAISERIQELSRDVLRVNQGSLYPALHRLEHQGWIALNGASPSSDDARASTSSRPPDGGSSATKLSSGRNSRPPWAE